MTEIALNERLEELERERCDRLPPPSNRRTGKAYRRQMHIKKNDELMRIVTRHYVPHAGYIDWGFDGPTLQHSGSYIKYPKNSNCQRWWKKYSNKIVRKNMNLPQKGNSYRRVFDYWWTLY